MMKMKVSFIVVWGLLGMLASVHAESVQVTVVDESRFPIEGADVIIEFVSSLQKNSKVHRGNTGSDGEFAAKGKIFFNGVFVKVTKSGYYEVKKIVGGGDHRITMVLRKVETPVPLFVREMLLKIPLFNEWLGFDFEVGDWVAPQGRGRGRTKDLLFKFNREYMGSEYGEKELKTLIARVKKIREDRGEKWDAEAFRVQTAEWKSSLQIKFPSELAGMVEEKSGYLPYSKMKMPHLAPKEGYRSEEIVVNKKSYRTEKDERESLEELRSYVKNGVPEIKPTGYFIRTRVTEVGGNVIKANYAKLPKMISVGAAGSINFIYYFNPVVNDRNLEYRPKSNLATEQRRFYDP